MRLLLRAIAGEVIAIRILPVQVKSVNEIVID